MKKWPKVKEDKLLDKKFLEKKVRIYWHEVFEKTYRGENDTWDYQLLFASFINDGLVIIPNVNLISNIGNDSRGAHYVQEAVSGNCDLPLSNMTFPLKWPNELVWDEQYELFIEKFHSADAAYISFIKRIVVRYFQESVKKILKKFYYSLKFKK